MTSIPSFSISLPPPAFFLPKPFFFLQKIGGLFFLGLFRPSQMVAEIYRQSDERACSRRWLTI